MYSLDKRWQQLGELMVNYSAEVKPGERVMIAMLELETFPLVRAVYEAVVKAGGYPQVQFLSETLRHSLLKYGNECRVKLGSGDRGLWDGMGRCLLWIARRPQPV